MNSTLAQDGSSWRQDKALEWDRLAPWYDCLWPRGADLAFYIELSGRCRSRVLELGCGTGRVACELASTGARVLGIDISPGQLAQAEARRRTLIQEAGRRVEFRQASATDFQFAESFGLIIACFSTVFEIGDAAARTATYRQCYEHLEAGGVLALDNSFHEDGADPATDRNRPAGQLKFINSFPDPNDEDTLIQHFEAQHYWSDGRMKMTILLDAIAPEGALRRSVFEVVRHYATPDQTQRELTEAGFKEIQRFGGFSGEAFDDPNLGARRRQVFVAHKT